MKPAFPVIAALSAALALFAAPAAMASAKGDKEAGKRVYVQCAACHKIDASGSHGVGPNLNKVIGRRAGTAPGFRFSPAMTASNRVWTETALDAYLAAPMASIPGSRMPFAGLRNAADRRNVIAYIKSAAK
jgi:cytochrome c